MPTSFFRGTQEHRQAEEVFLRTFWQEIGQFCAAVSKPSKDHQVQASLLLHINHRWRKFISRTLKCYLRQSWAHHPEDSKNNPLVRAHKRRANRDTSLVIGRGHISWLMIGLLALTRQKQLTMSRQATSQPASQCQVCLFQDCLSRRNSRSAERFSEFFVMSEKWDREINSRK